MVCALLPDRRPIAIEDPRDRRHSRGDESQQASSPRHTQALIQSFREERKGCAKESAQKSIRSKSACPVYTIAIGKIRSNIQKSRQKTDTQGNPS